MSTPHDRLDYGRATAGLVALLQREREELNATVEADVTLGQNSQSLLPFSEVPELSQSVKSESESVE